MMGVPPVPMAALLSFWGGLQSGYWAFTHNPQDYAKKVQCPTLLLFGVKDDRVSMEETKSIFANLGGKKVLALYPEMGHNVFTPENQEQWKRDVTIFLQQANPEP